MKESTSRRHFLQKSAMATTGLALLSTGVANAFSSEIPYDGYNPYSEEKTDLRTTLFGAHLRIKGVIFDATGATPLSNVIVEVWHLSPQSNKFRHRAKLKTDEFGRYKFITDFPSKDDALADKVYFNGNKIYFKLSHSNKVQFTELFVDKQGANISGEHWQENSQLGEKLLPTTEMSLDALTINFNLSL
jgi:hypothetical protein